MTFLSPLAITLIASTSPALQFPLQDAQATLPPIPAAAEQMAEHGHAHGAHSDHDAHGEHDAHEGTHAHGSHDMGHMSSDAPITGPEVTVGDLTISGGFSRATLPGAPVAGGFLTVSNSADTDDRLIAASSSASGRTEIHEMRMTGDVMVMQALPDGLEIPAGETVALRPGGYHLMFMDLAGPLTQGETVDVTLTFEAAGEVTVPLHVGAPNAAGHH